MNFTQRIVDIIAPPGTTRRQLPELAREVFNTWREDGAIAASHSIFRTIKAHGYGLLVGFGLLPNPHRFVEEPSYSYEEWITDNEPTIEALAAQPQIAESFALKPTFSIVTPVYNPPAGVFIETIESVLAQTYPHWTLYLTDGGSDDPDVLVAMERFSQLDSRIQVITLEENLGISGNSNVALERADGDFVSLLDHDDLIAPNMLFEVASCLNEQAAQVHVDTIDQVPIDIIYFDEDKISEDGKTRQHPWMKPAKGYETLLSHNFLMHCVLRRTLMNDVGGFDPIMDGAQDWDLMLRCSTQTDRIVHIAKILYHWRQIEGSAASDINAKPWAITAQKRCINAHLQRIGANNAVVDMPKPGQIRIKWPHDNKRISIIILTKDKPDLIGACIRSILEKSSYSNYEIIVVDTGSTNPDTLAFYESLVEETRVKIVNRSGRFNFSAANNFGASHATGELLLFLNNDTEVISPDWLEEMAGWALRSQIGIVGAKLTRPNGTLQHVGVVLGISGHAEHIFDGYRENTYGSFGLSNWLRNYYAVTGACFMLTRELFNQLNGWDELYEMAFNDVDLCIRAHKLGYRNLCATDAHLLHHEGESRGHYFPLADLVRATLQMWSIIQSNDPYYNSNLSMYGKLPTLARPDELRKAKHMLKIWQMFDLIIPSNEEVLLDNDSSLILTDIEFDDIPVPDYWHKIHICDKNSPLECQCLLFVLPSDPKGESIKKLQDWVSKMMENGVEIDFVCSSSPNFTIRDITMNNCKNKHSTIEVLPGLETDMRVATQLLGTGNYDGICLFSSISWRLIHAARAFNIPSFISFEAPMHQPSLGGYDRNIEDAYAYAIH